MGNLPSSPNEEGLLTDDQVRLFEEMSNLRLEVADLSRDLSHERTRRVEERATALRNSASLEAQLASLRAALQRAVREREQQADQLADAQCETSAMEALLRAEQGRSEELLWLRE